jgi:hypothetical protein
MGLKSATTKLFKYKIAQFMCDYILAAGANTYVTIGRPLYWGDDATEFQSEVGDIDESKNYADDSRRNFIAMKKIEFADLALVVPRLDWRSGTVYDQYNDHIDMFSHDRKTIVGLVFANSNITIPGTVNVSTSTAVYGANTTFSSLVLVGDQITINSQTRTVSSITSDTLLSVSSAFTTTGNGNTMVILANNRVARNTAGLFSGNVDQGTLITVGEDTKEVVDVRSSRLLVTNTKFTYSYSGNATAITLTNKYPLYANNFYVRNSRDQVFKCLFTPKTTGGAYIASTIEPTIDIDGQLPEDPYIETGDFYKWKYLYTIPYGLKQKFFTRDWMPVITDASASAAAVDGRIDIIDIKNSGNQYFSLTGTGNTATYPILTIVGDGTGANVTAQVESGRIVEVNILNGGSGYTKANVIVSDSDQLGGTTNAANVATFDVVVGPQGGHASNPAKELGCYSFMICSELSGTENGKIPVSGTEWGGSFDFRQITLLRDPLYANGIPATSSVYRGSTKISVAAPASPFQTDETVFVGSTLLQANVTATVAAWDVSQNELLVINVDGDAQSLTGSAEIKGASSGAKSAILSVEDPEVNTFSGDILYIENRLPIIRNSSQSEQIRIVLSF